MQASQDLVRVIMSHVMSPGSKIDLVIEWQECRATIGRIDQYLVDTRKYGFTLVTVLLTASALVAPGNPVVDRIAASAVVMVLLLTLFLIDLYWWILLRAAAGRATQLEQDSSGEHVPMVSGVLAERAKAAHSTWLGFVIYILFVGIAAALPIVTLALAQPSLWLFTSLCVVVVAGAVVLTMVIVRTKTDAGVQTRSTI